MEYICSCGNEKAVKSLDNFQKEAKCRKCSSNPIRNREEDLEAFIKLAQQDGYKLDPKDYVNSIRKINIECPEGHKYSVTYRTFVMRGQRCKKCFLEIMKGRTGGKNPRWNPNLTDEERIQNRDYPEYEAWRKEVFTRDNYTCVCCQKRGNDGTYLAAHHLQNFAEYPDLRHNPDNGVTLCRLPSQVP